jgi:hypothetical protein
VTDPTPEALSAAKRIPLGYGTFEDQRLAAARIIDETFEPLRKELLELRPLAQRERIRQAAKKFTEALNPTKP